MMGDKEDLVVRAIIAERAERYEDMARCMKSIIEKGGDVSDDERNLFAVAYKNMVAERRNAWRIISAIENSYIESDFRKTIITDYLNEIASEQRAICKDALYLLDNFLIPSSPNFDPKVFSLKMKGDYYRYLAEVNTDPGSRENEAMEAQKAYEEAYVSSKEHMAPIHPVRLGLALNFSVFYYEILNETKKACELASSAFDDAIQDQDLHAGGPHDDDYKDAMLIMQLLRDNLAMWTSDSSRVQLESINTLGDKSYTSRK